MKQSAEEERPNVEFDQNKPEGQALDYAISAVPKEHSSLPENSQLIYYIYQYFGHFFERFHKAFRAYDSRIELFFQS